MGHGDICGDLYSRQLREQASLIKVSLASTQTDRQTEIDHNGASAGQQSTRQTISAPRGPDKLFTFPAVPSLVTCRRRRALNFHVVCITSRGTVCALCRLINSTIKRNQWTTQTNIKALTGQLLLRLINLYHYSFRRDKASTFFQRVKGK